MLELRADVCEIDVTLLDNSLFFSFSSAILGLSVEIIDILASYEWLSEVRKVDTCVVRRRWEDFDKIIPLRDLRLRVCLAGLSEGLADAIAMMKGFVIFVRALDNLDLWLLDVIMTWWDGCWMLNIDYLSVSDICPQFSAQP